MLRQAYFNLTDTMNLVKGQNSDEIMEVLLLTSGMLVLFGTKSVEESFSWEVKSCSVSHEMIYLLQDTCFITLAVGTSSEPDELLHLLTHYVF
jgi:hypothetical protein